MAKNKAFIRYANNKAVPGSLIVRKKAPSVGVWKEVNYDLCCDNVCPEPPPPTPFCTENWMFENFDGTTFRNGDPIPEVTDNAAWTTLTTPAWCWYNNDPLNGQIYGKLYNWYAVNDPRGLAPEGWRVPTDDDWFSLITCVYSPITDTAGEQLKTTGNLDDNTGLWQSPNSLATNSSGFSALPGGNRTPQTGAFANIGYYGRWWSATEDSNPIYARYFYLENLDLQNVFFNADFKAAGYSVRLIKDI